MVTSLSHGHSRQWDTLHDSQRFRPLYPSEPVVRFVSRRFGGIDSPPTQAYDLLDLGCGAGRHLLMMSRAGHRVVGVDISGQGLVHAARRLADDGLAGDLREADMVALPFDPESFDGVVAYGVLPYGTREMFDATLFEIRRVLRPGAAALVVVRSTRDHRMGMGRQVAPDTVILESNETNEAGMTMHFVDPSHAQKRFSMFSNALVDVMDHSVGGGEYLNADLVVEVVK